MPDPLGTRAYVLTTHWAEPCIFYAATRHDVYRSAGAGSTWEKLPIVWPDEAQFSPVNALVLPI